MRRSHHHDHVALQMWGHLRFPLRQQHSHDEVVTRIDDCDYVDGGCDHSMRTKHLILEQA